MFKSVKLVRITIQVPEQFISPVTGVLRRFKLLHLIKIDETHLGRLGYTAEIDGDLLQEYDEFLKETEALLEMLHVRADGPGTEPDVIPEKEVFRVKEHLDRIRAEVNAALGDILGTERILGEKKALLERLRLLPDDLDFSRLANRTFIHWTVGLVPVQGLEKLEESLSQVHHALMEIGASREQMLILLFGLKRDWPVIERALKGALFEAIELPSGLTGTVQENISSLAAEIVSHKERRQDLAQQRETLQRKFSHELLHLRERIIAARQILSARRFFGKIDKSYLITGWIPERLCPTLEEELQRITDGHVIFEKVDPEDIREVREGIIKIPILFNNPFLISPFEKLTDLYGTPRYKEVEPTIFFALTFLTLFGMMFGDVGQGLVLFLLGYLIFRRFYRYMDYGIILMECGLVSTLFGFLYGTVFGLENIIPALWFRPLDNITYLVKIALFLGVALVSLGLRLNLVNAIRLKEFDKLLGVSGFAGALLYWMTAGLAMKYLLTGRVGPEELSLLGWVTAVSGGHHDCASASLSPHLEKGQPQPISGGAGLVTDLMESIVEVFDDLLQFVTNTISFIRVAAFALSHTALFIAVFSIAQTLSHEKDTGILYWFIVALGNIVIIFLEGLIVSIQTVRLEYYEFFGKFFRGGGERFKPYDREIGR